MLSKNDFYLLPLGFNSPLYLLELHTFAVYFLMTLEYCMARGTGMKMYINLFIDDNVASCYLQVSGCSVRRFYCESFMTNAECLPV